MAVPKDLVSEQRLRESFLKQAALAQLHRLCDQRGRPTPAGDLMDALRMIGGADGHTSSAIEQSHLELTDSGLMDFSVRFVDGEEWRGAFQPSQVLLPDFVRLDIVHRASKAAKPSADHRIRSAVHYFFGLVENPDRDPEPFRELLADAFSLHYIAEPITDFDNVRGWVTGRLASVVASEHDIHRITCHGSIDGDYRAEVVMKSQALFPDGSGAISRNTQHWRLQDKPEDRFPRLTEILIDRDAVEFFGPAPDYAPRDLPG